MTTREIVISKLDPPIHGTGHHQFHYKASFKDEINDATGYGQTVREAELDLKSKVQPTPKSKG